MQTYEMERLLRNIDARVTRLVQFLPMLATRQDLHEMIAEATSQITTTEERRQPARTVKTTDALQGEPVPRPLTEEIGG